MSNKKEICVIGLGYIGLPTSALLANRGYQVHGVDISQSVVNTINQGSCHIVEPELDTFVNSAINSGKLKAHTKPTQADVFMIAVPTPFRDGFVPNIDYVLSATRSITPYLKEGNLVILESTSPIGTTAKIEETLKEHEIDTSKLHIAYCPERVLTGNAIKELVENDRIVGGTTDQATKVAAGFYREFVEGEVLETSAKMAEMVKLTENSFRDTNIAFANEISILCDKFCINVWELIKLANRHPRVNILNPGAGVGGHCLAVDPWFIVHAGGEAAKLIKTSREVNTYKTQWVIEKIKNAAHQFEKEQKKQAKIACLGLAFKPNIDDLRESPALDIFRRLNADGLNVLAVEPNIEFHQEFEIVNYKKAIAKADIIVLLVAHQEFKNIDLKTDFDFCGVLNLNKTSHHKKAIAFFDFDGTITKNDSFIDFIRYYFKLYRMILGFIYLLPMLLSYKLKVISNHKAKESTLRYFFKNIDETIFKKKANEYSLRHIDRMLRDKAIEKINWHKQNKHKIVIVSASIEYYLKSYCEKNSIDLIATQLEIKNSKITGNLLGKNCHGIEKVLRIKERYNLNDYEEIYAYGDTKGDLPMLNLASKNKSFFKCF